VWLCGATAVGKSAIGWEVAERSRRAGHTTGFADLQQLGFLNKPGAGRHRLRAANLAALWAEFAEHRARRLVVVGPVEQDSQVRLYREALPAASLTLYRLHAGPEELGERIRQRGRGGGPLLAGDVLRGRPPAVLARAHEAAARQAAELDRAAIGDVRVDTGGRSVDAVAGEIVHRLGW
jgi:hypothetical protein